MEENRQARLGGKKLGKGALHLDHDLNLTRLPATAIAVASLVVVWLCPFLVRLPRGVFDASTGSSV